MTRYVAVRTRQILRSKKFTLAERDVKLGNTLEALHMACPKARATLRHFV